MKVLGNLREVFKNVKHKKPTPIFCPKCGNPNLKLSSSFDYWLTPRNYLCTNCGYMGPVYMELEKEEEEKTVR